MGVSFNEAEFMQELEESMSAELEKVRRQIIRELSIIGERCINEARLKGSYTDHTGNLRSSVGYVIVEDGQIAQLGGFEPVNGAKEGSEAGKEYARSLATNYPQGYTLIVVAGMHYAEYVAAKGYDVLDSSELLARQLADKLIKN